MESVDEKAERLQNMVLDNLDEVCPEKIRKISILFCGREVLRLVGWLIIQVT